MRRPRCCKSKLPIIIALFGGAVLCFCCISFKIFLIFVALALILAGVWLLKSC